MPARPKRHTPLSFASCNLYNLHLPERKLYGRPGWDAAAYAAKRDWLAQALRWVDADVWGFQELWHAQALQEVFEAAGLAQDYQLIVPPGHAGQGIACAAAVRRGLAVDAVAEPARAPVWIADFPPGLSLRSGGDDPQSPGIALRLDGFSRPVLRFHVRTGTAMPDIAVHVAHLKSKAPSPVHGQRWFQPAVHGPHAETLGSALATLRRTAEAAALRWLLTERMRADPAPVVVMGDLNDDRQSTTLSLIGQQPALLQHPDRRGGSATALYATELMEGRRTLRDVSYTYVHEDEHCSLDHILVSQAFYDRARARLWRFEGLKVYNDHLNLGEHGRLGTPDHGIVKACFAYDPA